MRKQVVFLLVFFVLALGISLGVFFSARKRERAYERVREWEKAHRQEIQKDPYQPLDPNTGRPGAFPPAQPLSPTDNVQNALKTIQDVQRINRMNDDLRRQQQQPRPATPKK